MGEDGEMGVKVKHLDRVYTEKLKCSMLKHKKRSRDEKILM